MRIMMVDDDCRVIMITGHLDLATADEHWRPARVAEVLVKPVDEVALREMLARAGDERPKANSRATVPTHAQNAT